MSVFKEFRLKGIEILMTALLLHSCLLFCWRRLTGVRPIWCLIDARFLHQVLLCLTIDRHFDQFFQVVLEFRVGLFVVNSLISDGLQKRLDIKIVAPDPSLETSESWSNHTYHFKLPGPLLILIDLEGIVYEKVWVTVSSLLAKFGGEWHLVLPLEGKIWATWVNLSQTCLFEQAKRLIA